MTDVNDYINILVNERNYTLAEKEREISNYKQELNECKKKIEKMENELNNKDNQINNNQSLLKDNRIQLQNIKNQLQDEINSKQELKRKLTSYKSKYMNQGTKINSLQTEINNIRQKNKYNNNKIISLLEEIKIKDEELKKLNLIIKVTKSNDKLSEPITISFSSSYINEGIVCHYNDTFSEIEEKLYQKYPLLKQDNVCFLYNGKMIEKNQSVLLNEITDKAKILIVHNN